MLISPLALLTPALALISFGIDSVHSETRTNTKGCVTSQATDSWDYFPDKIAPQYAENWNMTYHLTYKILYNFAVDESYLMYQCGTQPPESEEGKHDLTISVPLQGGVAITQTTQINQLEQLGLRRQMKAYVGDFIYVSSPCLKTLNNENITVNLHDPSVSWADSSDGADVALFLKENPDLLIIHGSAPNAESTTNSNNIIVSEASEGVNRAIFEWHKVYGALFNLEKEANDQFEASSSRFDCAVDNAEYLSTTVLKEQTKPTVLWGYYSAWEKAWSVATCDPRYNYYCEYADKCFADILHAGETMNTTEFVIFGKEADVWIYSGYDFAEIYDKYEELKTFKSVKNNKVYDVLGSGQGPWFEQKSAEYDVVMQDFCQVVGHTDETNQQHTRQYLRKVLPMNETEAVGSLGDCELGEIDIQWESRATQCKYIDPSNPLHVTEKSTEKVTEKSTSAAFNVFSLSLWYVLYTVSFYALN